MDQDEIEIGDEWTPACGYLPLLEAEQRLAVARRTLPGIATLIERLNLEAETDAQAYLEWVRSAEQASAYAGVTEAKMAADELRLAVETELPAMLCGTLIVYLFGLLESCLAGCLDTAAARRETTAPKRVRNPLLEGYLDALADVFGVEIEWSEKIWRELHYWRAARNAIAHRLETPSGTVSSPQEPPAGTPSHSEMLTPDSVEQLVDLIEAAVMAADAAMVRFDEPA